MKDYINNNYKIIIRILNVMIFAIMPAIALFFLESRYVQVLTVKQLDKMKFFFFYIIVYSLLVYAKSRLKKYMRKF